MKTKKPIEIKIDVEVCVILMQICFGVSRRAARRAFGVGKP